MISVGLFSVTTAICAPISLIQSMQAQYNVGGFRYLHHPVPILSLEHAIRVFWSLPDEQKNLERMLEWAAQKGVMNVQDYQRLYRLSVSVDNLEVTKLSISKF